MSLREKSKNDPNRHAGVSSKDCSCGLVHDDDLPTTEELRNKVIDALGGKCSNPRCRWLNEDGTMGCADRAILQVDHVFNDGSQDKDRHGRWAGFYWKKVLKAIQEGSKKYQLLCANCNWRKREYTYTGWKKYTRIHEHPN